MKNSLRNQSPRRQRGVSTLLIAMLLLAIVTIITLLGARHGVSEQRTSGNEYRYKMAFHVAETGLHQSMEYIKLNTATMLSTAVGGWLYSGNMKWAPCTQATTITPDPCLAEPDESRRNGMYRYVGGTNNGVLPVAGFMPKLDPTASATGVDQVGEFPASYRSYATLCRLDMTNPDAPQCSLAPVTTGNEFYVTVVSQGRLSGENTVATVKQSFGTFYLIGLSPAAPLIALGANFTGNAQVVPNPDAGGFGVPVSVWSSGDANFWTPSGGAVASKATCHLGEWLTTDPPATPDEVVERQNGICADCICNSLKPGYGLLSGKSNQGQGPFEAEDILDNDGNLSTANPPVQDVQPADFPRSLFGYVFDVNCSTTDSTGCAEATRYLNDQAGPLPSCASLGPATGGLYWHKATEGDCNLPSAHIGSLERPAVLVSDTPVSLGANTRFFGIIFIRGGSGISSAGGGQVYGSVILEGNAEIAGTPTFVYNKAVLANVRNSPDFVRYGPISGSWSDTLQ